MSKVSSTIRCAYCDGFVTIDLLGKFPGRTTVAGNYKCPHCDSTFAVEVKTIRKAKGKRFRAGEAKRKAEHDALVQKFEAENDVIAERLLAEPGCTCGTDAAKRSAAIYHDLRRPGAPDGLSKGGIGKRAGHMHMPLEPRHRYHCPARKE
jgi:hypothetical protein